MFKTIADPAKKARIFDQISHQCSKSLEQMGSDHADDELRELSEKVVKLTLGTEGLTLMQDELDIRSSLIMIRPTHRPKTPILLHGSKVKTLGRSKSCDLRLLGDGVSRRHATIRFFEGKWLIGDCGSKNGISVNDKQIPSKKNGEIIEVELHDSDEVAIGSIVLRFAS